VDGAGREEIDAAFHAIVTDLVLAVSVQVNFSGSRLHGQPIGASVATAGVVQ